MAKVRKKPFRMCVGCQEMKIKKDLIRIVRTPDETIEIDYTGKKSGRGAYICPQQQCLEKARKGNRLEKALKHSVSSEVYEKLLQELESSE
ncbi:RNase P modulator RnpM [Desulfofalx alkaliphila]|uniref:RNase P modulator RnpM n=1 Tax=Desulfofalx alkaliphila TaxID=105483 RepID=UPI0004E1B5E9|nr:YlxR family protein [Desulfofalx alkaliphila]